MQYDDIIVGGGSSGAALAARLSEDANRTVLLIEAGPDYRTIKETPHDLLYTTISMADHDWGWTAQATSKREMPFYRGKVTSGCSAINAAVAIRGVPADFDQWAAAGNEQWSFDKVLPFFRKLEHDADFGGDLHGKEGPVWIERPKRSNWHPTVAAFYAACRAMGFPDSPDINDPQSTGVGPCARNLHEGIRVSTAVAYLGPARNRPNLTIRGECVANRLIIENGRAAGVEVQSKERLNKVEGSRITLCAGAFASPAILMRSGIGPRAELQRHGIRALVDAPGVGRNLIDHPQMSMLAALSADAIKQAPRTDHSRFSVLLRCTSPRSGEFNDMQPYLTPMVDLAMWPGAPFPPEFPPPLMMTCVLQRPRSRGELLLRSADPIEQPEIQLNYFDDPEDMRRMIDGLRLGWRLMHTPDIASGWQGPIAGMAGQILDQATIDSDPALADFICSNCGSICHPVGTAKMGPESDKQAVLDQYCRVRGVERLRVVDASVMPCIVRANTNLTCIMIAERVADWMRAEI